VKALFQTTLTAAIGSALVCSALLAGQTAVLQSGVVEGRVFARDGKPVAGVRVGITAIPEGNAAEGPAALLSLSQTDDEGRYRLENVPPGRYFVVAGSVDVPVYFPGVRRAADATPVTVTASSTIKDRDFHLTSPLTLRVRGRIVGEGKGGPTQVFLSSRTVGPANPLPTPALISPDGTFEFPRVYPGRYDVRVVPSRDFAPVTLVVNEADINDLQLDVPLSAVTDFPITLKISLDVEGPTPRFALQFQTSDTRPWRTLLVGGPEASLRIAPGEFSVKPVMQGNNALPFGYSIKTMTTADGKDLKTQPLVVGADSRPEIRITLTASSAAWMKVSGRVTGLSEVSPRESTTIQLEGPPVAAPITAEAGPDGAFEIPKVLPGTYQVRLSPAVDSFPRSLVVGYTDLTNVEFPARLGAFRVSGRVADLKELQQEGVLTPNKRLVVSMMQEPRETARPNMGAVAADGSFSFTQVPVGTYRLTVGICEFDVCAGTGGMSITVVDRDLGDVAVFSGRTGTSAQPQRGVTPPTNADLLAMATVGVPVNTGNVTFSGIVVMPGASSVPQFRLRFTTGAVTRTIIVGSSPFTAELPPGDYTVSVTNLPEGFTVRSITDGAANLLSQPLRVAPTPTPRITVTLDAR
jgi:hypothetical protein